MVTSQTLRTFFYEYQTFANTNLPVLSRSITRFFTQGLEILNSLKATAWIVSKNTAAAPKEQWLQAFSSCENSNDDYSGRNSHCWWHMVVRSSNTHDDLFLRDKNKWQIVSIEEMSSKLISPTVSMASCHSPVLVGVECCHHPQEAATAFLVWNMTRLRTQLAKFLLSKTACSQETTMKASLICAAQRFHTKANQRRRKLTCIQFGKQQKKGKKKEVRRGEIDGKASLYDRWLLGDG